MAAITNQKFRLTSQSNNNKITIKFVGVPTVDKNGNTVINGAPTDYMPISIKKLWNNTTMTNVIGADIALNNTEAIEFTSTNESLYGIQIKATGNFKLSGNICSLTSGEDYKTRSGMTKPNTFKELFKNNIYLTDISEVAMPDVMTESACESMFEGCTNLQYGLTSLPAGSLGKKSYKAMFKNCTRLTNTPTLVCDATGFATECFAHMFENCTSMEDVMELDLSDHTNIMYDLYDNGSEMEAMYKGCTHLTTGYEYISCGYTKYCFKEMFMGCTALETPASFGSTTGTSIQFYDDEGNDISTEFVNSLKTGCCERMYANSGVTSIDYPSGKADWQDYVYDEQTKTYVLRDTTSHFILMYENCKGLIGSKTMSFSDCGNRMCERMFSGCTNITSLSVDFYNINSYTASNMFYGCTAINSITLNVHTLHIVSKPTGQYDGDGQEIYETIYPYNCCEGMFRSCTGLRNITKNSITLPNLPPSFGVYMFENCTNLNTINMRLAFDEDQSTNISKSAAAFMFKGCRSLSNINNLTIDGWLGSNALEGMFMDCTSFESIWSSSPKELKINGDRSCYQMFKGCTNVRNMNNLIISYLKDYCCEEMYAGCIRFNNVRNDLFQWDGFPKGCFKNMFKGCTSIETIPVIPTLSSTNTSIEYYPECFYGMFANCTKLNTQNFVIQGQFSKRSCYEMFAGCTSFGSLSNITVDNIIIDPNDREARMDECFKNMFTNCTSLVKGTDPIIIDFSHDANTYGYSVCESMFAGCTALDSEPIIYAGSSSSSKSFGKYCFYNMYNGCISMDSNITEFTITPNTITNTHTIYGGTFSEGCFREMYTNCTSLTSPLNIMGGTIGNYCCCEMYKGCTSLTTVPTIMVASSLGEHAFDSAFTTCIGLSTVTSTSYFTARTVGAYCFYRAFKNCKLLTTMPPLNINSYGDHACEEMFMSSGISDIGISLNNATTVGKFSFYSMFEDCTSLTSLDNAIIPGAYINYQIVTEDDLTAPGEEYPMYHYVIDDVDYNAFYGIQPGRGESGSTLAIYYIIKDIVINGQTITVPPRVTLDEYTFGRMFYGCTNLARVFPKMNNISLGKYSCYQMFGFTKFTEPPEITSLKYEKATKPGMQADEWNAAVSNGRLAGGSGIDAVTPTGIQIYKLSDEYRIDEVPEGAWCGMFMNSSIAHIPNLYVKKLNKNAANSMFRNCQMLTNISEKVQFNMINIGDYGFAHIFDNCQNLVFNDNLGMQQTNIFSSLSILGKYALNGMFANCKKLAKTIILNENISFDEGTFSSMYLNCASITGTVTINTGKKSIYNSTFANMFRNCSGISASIVKIGAINRSCCENMFMRCYTMTSATLEVQPSNNQDYALSHMYYGCRALNEVHCNLRAVFNINLTNAWLYGVAKTGRYYYNEVLDKAKIVHDPSSVPEGWDLIIGYKTSAA